MGSTFFSLHYHIVFSTKQGRPFIKPEWQPRLHAYLGGIIKGMNGVPEIVGGVEDHVHILTSLRTVHCIADVLRDEEGIVHGAKREFQSQIRLARGLCGIHGKPHDDRLSTSLHCHAGGASS